MTFLLPQAVTDGVDLFNRTRTDIAATTTFAESAALEEGIYDVWCDTADIFTGVGTTNASLTTSNGYKVKSGNVVSHYVRKDHKIGVILAAGTATVSYHKVG